jgi:hypothetical protein
MREKNLSHFRTVSKRVVVAVLLFSDCVIEVVLEYIIKKRA